jgi:hypothetical protein
MQAVLLASAYFAQALERCLHSRPCGKKNIAIASKRNLKIHENFILLQL